jgi:hypothetical protein
MAGSPAITDSTPSAPAPAASTAPAKPVSSGPFSQPSVVIAAPVPVTERDLIVDAVSKVQDAEADLSAKPAVNDKEWRLELADILRHHVGEPEIGLLIGAARIAFDIKNKMEAVERRRERAAAMRNSNPHQITLEARARFDRATARLDEAEAEAKKADAIYRLALVNDAEPKLPPPAQLDQGSAAPSKAAAQSAEYALRDAKLQLPANLKAIDEELKHTLDDIDERHAGEPTRVIEGLRRSAQTSADFEKDRAALRAADPHQTALEESRARFEEAKTLLVEAREEAEKADVLYRAALANDPELTFDWKVTPPL